MNLDLLARVNQLQFELGFSDANMGAKARNWIDQDDDLLRRWIAHLESTPVLLVPVAERNERRKLYEAKVNEVLAKVSPTVFVLDVHETDPVIHSLEIYIGEKQPPVPENAKLHVFPRRNSQRFKDFLMAGEWDMATIYKSQKCPNEAVDELTNWMNCHMSMTPVEFRTYGKDEG